jgi:aminoglycoside phosphotransferase (APT) family kinase protein
MDAELRFIAGATGAERAWRGERVQSLWSGYGEIVRVHLASVDGQSSVVVKWVQPPRVAPDDASHARKCRSYDVEAAFYTRFAARCDESCRVPALLASRTRDAEWLFVLEDLDAVGYGGRRRDLSARETEACLAWLAAFHARFVGVAPEGLWETGTYWHLATRQDELDAMAASDADLRRAAPLLDRRLREARYQTIVHGDAKPANFCFATGGEVAAVDFQYAGGGCGMKDVAYLLYGVEDPEPLVDVYFGHLGRCLAARRDVDASALEREWRALYPIAYADFARFLAGWSPSHWRHDVIAQRTTREVLRGL